MKKNIDGISAICGLFLLFQCSVAFVQTTLPSLRLSPASRSVVRLFEQPNRLARVSNLQNDFFVLRHGQSAANVAKVISSDLACDSYGLSSMGQMQAKQAGKEVCELCNNYKSYSGICILTSDFRRSVETARAVEQAAKYYAYCPVGSGGAQNTFASIPDQRLRERGFGQLDGTSDANYARVWDEDIKNSSHELDGVESVDSVMARATELVLEYDAQFSNYMVVLVGHSDVLQILQCACFRAAGTEHRRVNPLETGEIRALAMSR